MEEGPDAGSMKIVQRYFIVNLVWSTTLALADRERLTFHDRLSGTILVFAGKTA